MNENRNCICQAQTFIWLISITGTGQVTVSSNGKRYPIHAHIYISNFKSCCLGQHNYFKSWTMYYRRWRKELWEFWKLHFTFVSWLEQRKALFYKQIQKIQPSTQLTEVHYHHQTYYILPHLNFRLGFYRPYEADIYLFVFESINREISWYRVATITKMSPQ